VIHYHGGPVTPIEAARTLWTARHAMVSFAHPDQLALAAEVCQSFVLDNGAFSAWKAGTPMDFAGYREWALEWSNHPGFDWCVIPDVIDGTEQENHTLVEQWFLPPHKSVPVWHMHESMGYLNWLVTRFPRVAIGSSGKWSSPGTEPWWERMGEAMKTACDSEGKPKAKLHGLRMLNPTIFSHLPLSSADSCGVARNIGLDVKWDKGYLRGLSKSARTLVIADRYERHASAAIWEPRSEQMSFTLMG
jgi:hypothetical protein